MDNTANKQARLNEAMARAKKLIKLESNGTLDKIAAAHKDGINNSLASENVMTKELMTTTKNVQHSTQPRRMSEGASKVPQAIREAFPPQNVSQIISEGLNGNNQTTSQSIDYPMIRTIVEDVVRKYASSLNKRIISEGKENSNVLNTFSIGKTFKFLDSKGNIYEATLRKISNINEIKDKKGTKI